MTQTAPILSSLIVSVKRDLTALSRLASIALLHASGVASPL